MALRPGCVVNGVACEYGCTTDANGTVCTCPPGVLLNADGVSCERA